MTKPTWSAGYVADVTYTSGFYREMAPEHMAYCALINGYAMPLRQGLRYCELGCGRGYGTLLLAAANPDREFVGIDFNPAHISEAKELAKKADISNIRFVEASFSDAAEWDDPSLSNFDIVALHGVYTWVSAEVKKGILQFLRRHLVPGGYCYVSYNCMPGWAPAAPVQRLILEYGARSAGDSAQRFAAAMKALTSLAEAQTGYMQQNPAAKRRIERMKKQSSPYLVHEFMNENWDPIYVTGMLAEMGEAKLDFVGSASLTDNRMAFNVPEDLRPLVEQAPDIGMRELLRDFAVNRQFRRDIYVKGGTRPGRAELESLYERIVLAPCYFPPEKTDKWSVPVGTARPDAKALETVIDAVRHGPTPISLIREKCEKSGVAWANLPAIIELLMQSSVVLPLRADHASVDGNPARRLNRVVFDAALQEDQYSYLASPKLGSAVGASYPERLLAPLVLAEDPAVPVEAGDVLKFLKEINKTPKDKTDPSGKNLENAVASLLHGIRTDVLPRWRSLGIVDG